MPHYLLELALWILLAFILGGVIGYVLRALLAGNPRSMAIEAHDGDTDEHESPEHSAVAVEAPSLASEPSFDSLTVRAERPKGIAQARGGKPDNLQRISGIGPKNERTLHSLGFFHFDQIAGWSDEEVAWVDNHLKFNGRIIREEWILQAGLLAECKEDEFQRLYGSGRRKQSAVDLN